MPTFSEAGKLGSIAPSFELLGTDERCYRLEDFKSARLLVVTFMCNHCPYVIATQGRINALAQEYAARAVAWIGINANDSVRYPDDSFAEMKVRAQEQGFVFPYLWDETQEVAKAFGAVCTPEFYVYQVETGNFILKYQGRLDDNWKDHAAVKRRELAEALDALLAGRAVAADQKPAIGCSIKWKD